MQGVKANLTKEQLSELYHGKEMSYRSIAKELGLSFDTIRRYAKKLGLTPRPKVCGWIKANRQRKIQPPDGKIWCQRCQQFLDVALFPSHLSMRSRGYCSTCNYEYERERYNELKRKGIEFLGGKCAHCGFNRHIAAFDFHHRDPEQKDVDWGSLRKRGWIRIKEELQKCELLCANCHRIHHAMGRDTKSFTFPAA